jgi:hypothetical protein
MTQPDPAELSAANELLATAAFQKACRLGCPKCGCAPSQYRFPPGKPEDLFFTCVRNHHWRPDGVAEDE